MSYSSRQFYNVNRDSVLTPQVRAIWDNMCIGVAVVNAEGICEYMNPIQRKADGFSRIPVEGKHITSLYVPHKLECIPTMGMPAQRQAAAQESLLVRHLHQLSGQHRHGLLSPV